jgi:hypothetical protein
MTWISSFSFSMFVVALSFALQFSSSGGESGIVIGRDDDPVEAFGFGAELIFEGAMQVLPLR